ncbi:MAG: DUF350 domain-containing protein [Verrucomicrobiales bacterium]
MFENATSLAPLADLADWRVVLYLVVVALFLWLAKQANQALAGFKLDEQLTEKDNKAVATSFAGFLLAQCLILHGVLTSPSAASTWSQDLGATALWSLIGGALLLLARVINDKIIFPSFCNKKELVQDRNVGLGAAQAGSYLATAFIIRAVVSDPTSAPLGQEIALSAIWFLITQGLFILFSRLYQRLTSFDLHAELEKDNPAAGVAFAGSLSAYGLLLAFFIQRYDSLLALVVWAAIAAALLCLIRLVIDKLLLPGSRLDDEVARDANWGAALIEVATTIGTALLISGSFA